MAVERGWQAEGGGHRLSTDRFKDRLKGSEAGVWGWGGSGAVR